jgi:hypothetical protein
LILQLEQVVTAIAHAEKRHTCRKTGCCRFSVLRLATVFQLHAAKNIRAAGVRRFRYEANHFNLETAQRQRQIQPTCGPKTNDSAISPNAAWSACNL